MLGHALVPELFRGGNRALTQHCNGGAGGGWPLLEKIILDDVEVRKKRGRKGFFLPRRKTMRTTFVRFLDFSSLPIFLSVCFLQIRVGNHIEIACGPVVITGAVFPKNHKSWRLLLSATVRRDKTFQRIDPPGTLQTEVCSAMQQLEFSWNLHDFV